MKLMEWNIHGRGGYGNYAIPVNMIVNTVLDIKPDVLVLLEFIEYANGFSDLQNALKKLHYTVFLTENIEGGSNGVLIAVKGMEAKKVLESTEFLEIKILYNNSQWINIVGMRVLTEGDYRNFKNRKILFEERIEAIAKQNSDFIMLLDANNGAIQFEHDKGFQYEKGERIFYSYQYIWRTVEDKYGWSLITPDQGGPYTKGKFSIVTGKNKGENYHTKEDHIISSFNKEQFQEVDYYWNFVKESNGYGELKHTDLLSDLEGLPDHAVLVADYNKNNN